MEAVFFGLACGAIASLVLWQFHPRPRPRPQRVSRMHVASVGVAMPAAAMASLRATLEREAAPGEGFAVRICRVAEALRAREGEWTHVGVRGYPLATAEAARDAYSALVGELGGSGDQDVEPDTDGGYRGGPARVSPAGRFSLATIVVLSTQAVPPVTVSSAARAREVLAAIGREPEALASGILVWSPHRTADGWTRAELARRAPPGLALRELPVPA